MRVLMVNAPAAGMAPGNEDGLFQGGPHPLPELVPSPRARAGVVLTGRATTVPFMAVPTGHQRTATDNATAGSTCAILY
jgi:hypothetical protein